MRSQQDAFFMQFITTSKICASLKNPRHELTDLCC
jgi:hypothetical protein